MFANDNNTFAAGASELKKFASSALVAVAAATLAVPSTDGGGGGGRHKTMKGQPTCAGDLSCSETDVETDATSDGESYAGFSSDATCPSVSPVQGWNGLAVHQESSDDSGDDCITWQNRPTKSAAFASLGGIDGSSDEEDEVEVQHVASSAKWRPIGQRLGNSLGRVLEDAADEEEVWPLAAAQAAGTHGTAGDDGDRIDVEKWRFTGVRLAMALIEAEDDLDDDTDFLAFKKTSPAAPALSEATTSADEDKSEEEEAEDVEVIDIQNWRMTGQRMYAVMMEEDGDDADDDDDLEFQEYLAWRACGGRLKAALAMASDRDDDEDDGFSDSDSDSSDGD